MRIILAAALAPLMLATAVGLLVLWPRGDTPVVSAPEYVDTASREEATVTQLTLAACVDQGDGAAPSSGSGGATSFGGECATARVRLDTGPEAGVSYTLPKMATAGISPNLHVGDVVIVSRTVSQDSKQPIYNYNDIKRQTPMVLLFVLFVAIVIGIGRLRGLSALIGLGITLLLLVKFMLPAILNGSDPVLVALVAGSASMCIILYLTHGFNARTAAALLGTLASLALTAVLAWVFVNATRVTGQSEDEIITIALAGSPINITGLLLAGIIIGSLGVLNDVTVTQASAVWELNRANPTLGGRQVYGSVMRIGRDHIASVVDTLVLAYAGAALPLLVLFAVAPRPLDTILNGEVVAIEIVRALVGSIGLVLSVPITTALCAAVLARSKAHRAAADATKLTGSPTDVEEDSPHVVTPPAGAPSGPSPTKTATAQARERLDAAADRRRRRKEANRRAKVDNWEPSKNEQEFWSPDDP